MKIKLLFLPFILSVFLMIPFVSKADDVDYQVHVVSGAGSSQTMDYYINYNSTPDFEPFVIGCSFYDSQLNYSNFHAYLIVPSTINMNWYSISSGNSEPNVFTWYSMNVNGIPFMYKQLVVIGVNESSPDNYISPYYLVNRYVDPTNEQINQADDMLFAYAANCIATNNFPFQIVDGDFTPDGNVTGTGFNPGHDDWIPDYENIPMPKAFFDGTRLDVEPGQPHVRKNWTHITFENADPDYYVEIKGSFRSIDYISFDRSFMSYNVFYQKKITGRIHWIVKDTYNLSSVDGFDFYDDGPNNISYLNELWSLFIGEHSVSSRTYVDDPDSLKDWYVSAKSALEAQLSSPMSSWNGVDFYVRYYVRDNNGDVRYGKWYHYISGIYPSGTRLDGAGYDPSDDDTGSEDGLPDDSTPDPDGPDVPDYDPEQDPDQTDTDHDGIGDGIHIPGFEDSIASWINDLVDWVNDILHAGTGLVQTVVSFINTSVVSLGQFPSLLHRVFVFLPSWCISAISTGLLVAVILRIFGR